MKTIELRNTETDEVLHSEEVENDKVSNTLKRYKHKAERLNTDNDTKAYQVEVIPEPTAEQKLENGKLVPKTLEELVTDGVLTQTEADERAANTVRAQRDTLLKQSDWMVLEDAPVNKTSAKKYRQALRDIPNQSGFPHNVDWPIKD